MAVSRASCCGFLASFVDRAFGGATGGVAVVVEPDVVPPSVVTDAVTVVVLPLPLPAPLPWPWPLLPVVADACVEPALGAWLVLGPLPGAEPCGLPALPCETVVVGAFGAFAPPAPAPLPCAAAPVTPTDAIVSAAANV
jgi:hypothetical protein